MVLITELPAEILHHILVAFCEGGGTFWGPKGEVKRALRLKLVCSECNALLVESSQGDSDKHCSKRSSNLASSEIGGNATADCILGHWSAIGTGPTNSGTRNWCTAFAATKPRKADASLTRDALLRLSVPRRARMRAPASRQSVG